MTDVQKGPWGWVRLALATVAVATLATFLLAFPLFPSGRLVLEEGDIAPRDLRAPRALTYESAIRTAEQQQLAVAAVEDVYTPPDADLARQQLVRVRQVMDYLSSVRADSLATPSQRRAWIRAVPELAALAMTDVDLLLGLSSESWDRVQLEVSNVVDQVMRQGVREGAEDEARQQVPTLVGLDLSSEEARVTTVLAQSLIVANSFYDEAATEAARAEARQRSAVVVRTFSAGEVIVREGQRVTALDLEALRELGLQQPRTRWNDVAAKGLLALLALGVMGGFLARFQPDVLWEGQRLLLLSLLLVLFLFLARLMVPDRTVLRYLFPAPALAILATATLGPQTAAVASILMGGAVGLMGDGSMELAIYAAVGGLVATVTAWRVERLELLFRAVLLIALAHVLVLLGFHLPLERVDLTDTGLALLMGVVNSVFSASLALGGLFLIGPLFDVITTFRLIELSQPDHPLLKRLLREAPGTYHHSLMVASLAEQAAEQIGADPLLTRVGAYYHDIGKLVRPYFFIENQMEGSNPHEQLDPHASAEIILGHVRDGLELARRYHLPARVRAFIPEHHGTRRANFQYARAVELAGGDAALVDEAPFRHSGPLPRSRETALVMLADSCEAAVRARRPKSPEEMKAAVDEIFEQSIRSGQLDDCPITMRELVVVRESFLTNLKGIYHPRITYPAAPPEKTSASVRRAPGRRK